MIEGRNENKIRRMIRTMGHILFLSTVLASHVSPTNQFMISFINIDFILFQIESPVQKWTFVLLVCLHMPIVGRYVTKINHKYPIQVSIML